jgi:rubrerythrin
LTRTLNGAWYFHHGEEKGMAKGRGQERRAEIAALKRALMLEMHGLRFYQVAAERTQSKAARALFEDLAEDEKRHKEELERHFRDLLQGKPISTPPKGPPMDLKFKDDVISRELKAGLKDAWFESAALAIGVMLERRAIEYYQRRKETSKDPSERELFSWLVEWEKGHLSRLMALERSMRDEIWHEARFWPLD